MRITCSVYKQGISHQIDIVWVRTYNQICISWIFGMEMKSWSALCIILIMACQMMWNVVDLSRFVCWVRVCVSIYRWRMVEKEGLHLPRRNDVIKYLSIILLVLADGVEVNSCWGMMEFAKYNSWDFSKGLIRISVLLIVGNYTEWTFDYINW